MFPFFSFSFSGCRLTDHVTARHASPDWSRAGVKAEHAIHNGLTMACSSPSKEVD
jgi:hypothetical protein